MSTQSPTDHSPPRAASAWREIGIGAIVGDEPPLWHFGYNGANDADRAL
jgi:hypothetical protein